MCVCTYFLDVLTFSPSDLGAHVTADLCCKFFDDIPCLDQFRCPGTFALCKFKQVDKYAKPCLKWHQMHVEDNSLQIALTGATFQWWFHGFLGCCSFEIRLSTLYVSFANYFWIAFVFACAYNVFIIEQSNHSGNYVAHYLKDIRGLSLEERGSATQYFGSYSCAEHLSFFKSQREQGKSESVFCMIHKENQFSIRHLPHNIKWGSWTRAYSHMMQSHVTQRFVAFRRLADWVFSKRTCVFSGIQFTK